MPNYDTLRVRLEIVLELVQVDRPGVAARMVAELIAMERDSRLYKLALFAEGAETAAGIARRWHRGALDAADARVAILRLCLALLRELAAREAE
jgi:hypothetical protein